MTTTNWSASEAAHYMHTFKRLPVCLDHGEGVYVWDVDGKRYMDWVAGIAVNVLGHAHPAVTEAICTQAKKLIHTSNLYYTIPQLELADLLIANSCAERLFFVNSGAEANEGAIKLARKWGKLHRKGAYEVITALDSFHGRTLAMVAATGQPKYQEPYAPMPAGFVNVPFNDLAAVKAATTDATVAIMVEPVQGESGVHPADPDYLQGLREWCDQEGMLLIFDEIQTGMGRTGHFLGYEWYKVEPDIFTMAKGLAGGVPIGAFLAKGSAAEALGPGDHGSTFGGSPLACAAGVATVKTLLEQELPANAGKQGGYLAAKLAELRREFPVITEIRARGLMIAFDLSEDVAPQLVLGGLEQGLILNNTGPHTIRIVPPLILNRREVDEGIGLLRTALSALKGAYMAGKVVLAYSGGLDTSVAIRWIKEKYDLDVITLTIDVGNKPDLDAIKEKALRIGAIKAYVVDGREDFVNYFVWPALQAGAIYENEYLLATALARPLIAKYLVDVARQEGASAVAHGCTGKGNDQVRFDVSIQTLAPDLKVIAPVREWRLTRDESMRYAEEHGIPVQATKKSPYSTDENLWGRSVEAGVLEDAWAEPPVDVWDWTAGPEAWPKQPRTLEIEFERGIPVALDGEHLGGVELIERLSKIAGEYGVGRVDHIENRLVGIKSREIYETPAGWTLYLAHQWLEQMTLTRDTARFKRTVADEYANLIYNGLFFSPFRGDLQAFVASTQRHVTGTVRVKLQDGQCIVAGRRSPQSLYSEELATYSDADKFDHNAAVGFIQLWGLGQRTAARVQMLGLGNSGDELPKLQIPKTE